jgi:RNA polymerase sigma-70 factor, ECF subfamily
MSMHESETQFDLSETEFLALLVKHEPGLRAFARVLLPDWDLVDESLQEASVTMWQKRGQLQSADGFVPWAKVILRFKCLKQLEKLRQRRPLLSNEILETLAARDESRSAIEVTQRGRALHACLNQFSAEHRELLLAPHGSNDSVVAIAQRQAKSPNALYKLLGRLREQLVDCIRRRLAEELA